MSGVSAPSTANRLLAALPVTEIERLRAHLGPVELAFKQGLHEPGIPVAHVYFVERGVCSITILDRAGLGSAACACYRLIEAEYARLIG